jgi:soluble cytochrome b562
MLDLEQSIAEGKLDAAQAQLAEIQQLRESAHKEFDVHDDEDNRK